MERFVAAADESAGKHHRDKFLFGGFLAPEQDWSRFFVPAWKERVLNGPPAIPYLHMTDIRDPDWCSQHGISRLDAEKRMDEAFSVIHSTGSLYPICVSLDAGNFRDSFGEMRVVASTGGNKPFDPDYTCFLAYTFMVLSYVEIFHPEVEKVDFAVEKKGHVTRYMQDFHSTLAQAFQSLGKPELSRRTGDFISAGKDDVRLQAADVLCWHTARYGTGTMTALSDLRRYAKIARREGARHHITVDEIAQLSTVLTPPVSTS